MKNHRYQNQNEELKDSDVISVNWCRLATHPNISQNTNLAVIIAINTYTYLKYLINDSCSTYYYCFPNILIPILVQMAFYECLITGAYLRCLSPMEKGEGKRHFENFLN